MRLGLTDTSWDYVGAVLAQCGDDEQIKFFRAFIKECLGWGTHMQVQFQLAQINSGLTPEEREVLGMLSFNEEV